MIYEDTLQINTPGRTSLNVTDQVNEIVSQSGMNTGLCHLFLQHTSASLILCENCDPAVRTDLETFMQHLVPDGDSMFTHTAEGPDDMPAHVRSVITHNDITLPVHQGQLRLGTWQGVFLWEHRHQGHSRKIIVTLMGES